MKVIEDMDVVEVIFGKETFEVGIIFKVEIIVIEWIEIGKIGEHGDNPGQEKEIEIDKVGHHLVLDQDQGPVQIEIGLDVSNVESMTTFTNECPNLVPDNSDRESDSAKSVSLHLADSDTGSDTEQYLNIRKVGMVPPHFCLQKEKVDLKEKYHFEQCLTKDQTKHICDKIETIEEIRIRKLVQQNIPDSSKQEMFANNVNQYEKALLSDRYTRRSNAQMDQWSILSDNIIYVKSKDSDIMNGIDIKSIDYRKHKGIYRKMNKEGGERIDIDFGESLEVMKSRYMDVYDNVYAEVVMTSRFDE